MLLQLLQNAGLVVAARQQAPDGQLPATAPGAVTGRLQAEGLDPSSR